MATLSIKVVPGARSDRVAGRYGDAIKIQVSAPPEQGKANDAVIQLLSRRLGVKPAQVTIVRGHGQTRKLVEVASMAQADAEARLLAKS